MNRRFSLHKIYEKDQCSFSRPDYSCFKFGDTACAEKFAGELFRGFIKQYRDLILTRSEIILLPSPYYAIPTASNFLCAFFKKHLDRFLFLNGKNATIEGKVHRKQTYVEDYGNMDYAQRMHLISNDTYYIDRQFIEGKFCIFLDDIKITGSHEHTVHKILKQHDLSGDFFFIYYAELMNKEIHPSIENHYNYFSINTTDDLIQLLGKDSFRFNTRVVKYILLMPATEFTIVLQNISYKQKEELLRLAISNNYHQITAYQKNIQQLNHHFYGNQLTKRSA